MQLISKLLRNSGLVMVSLGLLFAGVMILQSDVPFWSVLYGSSALGLGILTSLITFNELNKPLTKQGDGVHYLACKVCHKQTLAPYLIEQIVCSSCQYKMALKLNIAVIIFFLFVALPASFHVLTLQQDIRQQAKEPTTCAVGIWNPVSCRCGRWNQINNCAYTMVSRQCGAAAYCCTETQPGVWDCQK